MAFSRKELFALFPQRVAQISAALSHPARVQIMLHLVDHGETAFHELLEMMPLQQATVSQHLRILLQHNLVLVREAVPYTFYRMNPDQTRQACLVLGIFLGEFAAPGSA